MFSDTGCQEKMMQGLRWVKMEEDIEVIKDTKEGNEDEALGEEEDFPTNTDIKGKKIYMDGYMKSNLDRAKQIIKKDWDIVILYDGYEGCQPKDSKVLMSDGIFKNIQDIKVGDFILSPQQDGSNIPSKVLKTCQWFSDENYDVIELNRKKQKLYTCSYNHLIPINYKVKPRTNGKRLPENFYWTIRHYSACDFSTLSKKGIKINTTTLSSFPIERFHNKNNCDIEPYTLGILIGDGSMCNNQISITSEDNIILEEIQKYYNIIRVGKKQNTNAKSYHFSNRSQLSKLLHRCGLYGKRSGDKFIPQAALVSDIEYRKRLLAGLIDSDGYLSKQKSYSICTKSKELSENILFLIRTLGGRGNIRKVKKKIKKLNFEGMYYDVSFYLGNIELPLQLKRKTRDKNFFYLSANRYAIDVIPSRPCKVYGFELDSPSKWYITDNFTITHNSGKSVKAMQDCYYFDPSFNLERICFTPFEFSKVIRQAKPYQAVLYDEAYTGLSSRAAMSVINRTLVKMLAEIRQKRLFVAIVMPTFFDLDKYVALWRARALVHVYTGKNFKRGFFLFFNMERKKQLFVLGKKYYSYYKPPANFKGRFANTYIVDEKEYRKRKRDSLMKRGADQEKKVIEQEVLNVMLERLINIEGISVAKKSQILGINETTYRYKEKNYQETGEA